VLDHQAVELTLPLGRQCVPRRADVGHQGIGTFVRHLQRMEHRTERRIVVIVHIGVPV
jgi:hypothetical protein